MPAGTRISGFIVQYAIATAVAFSIVQAIMETSGLGGGAPRVFACVAALMLGLSLLFYNGIVANAVLLVAATGFTGYLFYLNRIDQLEKYRIVAQYYVGRFTAWIASFYMTGGPRNGQFEAIVFWAVAAATCMFIYLFGVKRYVFPVLFAAGFAAFSIQWSYGFFASDLALYVFVGAAVVGHVWHVYLRNARSRNAAAALAPMRFVAAGALPLCAALVAAVALIPKPNSPIRWDWLYDRFNDANIMFFDHFYYHRVEYFALNTTGFSEGESFLSGPVRVNNMQVMTVTTDDATLYLKGNGKNVYTGNSWRSESGAPDGQYLQGDDISGMTNIDDIASAAEEQRQRQQAASQGVPYQSDGSDIVQDIDEYDASRSLLYYRVLDYLRGNVSDSAPEGEGGGEGGGEGEGGGPEGEGGGPEGGGPEGGGPEGGGEGEGPGVADQRAVLRAITAMDGAADGIYLSDLLAQREQARATVRFDRLRTRSAFTPGKLISVENVNPGAGGMDATGGMYERQGAITMGNDMAEGFVYDVRYYAEDAGPTETLMLNCSYAGLYRGMIDIYGAQAAAGAPLRRRSWPFGVFFSYGYGGSSIPYSASGGVGIGRLEELAERAGRIREQYLGVPESLPPRVADLARSVVEESGALTDFGKASALERYLYSNYDYSLDAGYIAPGEDFVDSFLFSMRSGYCTHFASALAVMARCVGLPSRYVEGYMLPAERGADGSYRVTNAEAHAWVEIYFEGYGWKRFEPTASFQGWGTPAGAGGGSQAGGQGSGGNSLQSLYDMMMDQYGHYDDLFTQGQGAGGAAPFAGAASEEAGGGVAPAARVAAACAAAALAALALAAFAARRVRRRRRLELFAGGVPRDAVAGMLSHYCKILGWIGRGLGRAETLTQYAARVDESLGIGGGGLSSAAGVFDRLCYSDRPLTEADRSTVSALYPRLVALAEREMGRLAYRFRRHVLSDI